MARDQAMAQHLLEELGIARDRELEPYGRDALDPSNLTYGRRRLGQRPELLHADGRPPRGPVVWTEHEWHLSLYGCQHRSKMLRRHEGRDPVDGTGGHRVLSFEGQEPQRSREPARRNRR